MAKYYRTQTQSGIDVTPWPVIKQQANEIPRCIIALFTEDEALSYRQIKWFKGILLPALANATGHSKSYWETRLKLVVMPDEFQPIEIEYEGKPLVYLPSITILSTKKMSDLMDGSVAHLRNEEFYGDQFHWVELPDSSLRKE